MQPESYDQIDTEDRVIGTTNKADAHTKGHIHRIVAVYVFTDDGKLYVQHHVKANLLDHSVGGHVIKGETYYDAARRETEEEIGMRTALEHLGTFYSDETYTGSEYRHMIALFTCKAPRDWSFTANDEVKEIEPLTLKTIVERMNTTPQQFTPGFLNSMEYYLHAIKSELVLDLEDYRHTSV